MLRPYEDILQKQIYVNGTHYETEVVHILKSLVKPNMTVIDVGGHVGYYALGFAKQVGPSGKVVIFEAQPDLCEQIRASLQLNQISNVTVENIALSNHNGNLILYQTSDRGRSSISSNRVSFQQLEIPAHRLDDYLSERHIEHVDLVKCDIEGAEWYALRGMESLLTQISPIIVLELHRQEIEDLGGTVEALIDFLQALEYKIKLIHHKNGLIEFTPTNQAWTTQHIIAYKNPLPSLEPLLEEH
ncbi:MAG: FkbM family methyltransferase [Anaerolineales bacterium]|nr:FkbM family methyltransferase [Anaerolineales bacterium]